MTLKVAALGSSFAAGPGLKPVSDRKAGRSSRNYAHLLAEMIGADLVDLTVSGATLLNILDQPQHFLGNEFPPQSDNLPVDADIVTLTAGGNDLGYSKGMLLESMIAWLPAFIRRWLTTFVTPQSRLNASEIAQRIIMVIDKVQKQSPQATVFLVEYIRVFGHKTISGTSTPLTIERLQYYDHLRNTLVEGNRLAVEARPSVKLVPMDKYSQEHELGSRAPWVDGFGFFDMLLRGRVPYHPNIEGHLAVAQALVTEYKKAFRT